MKNNNQKQDLLFHPTLAEGGITSLPIEGDQQCIHPTERACGTHLLRKGLEAMDKKGRDLLFREMQASGLLPEI